MFLCYTDADNTDIAEEPSDDDEKGEEPFVGPAELMNIMSNLMEDHNGHELIADDTDKDGQANVIILSSDENDDQALPNMNFPPLMENFGGMFEELPIIEDVPIIEEVVISRPNQKNVPQDISDLLKPASIQQQMMNMMEEVTEFADRILQGMKNRMRPLRYEEHRLSAVHDPQGSNLNLPIRVIPIEWQGITEDRGMGVADTDTGSHGANTQHADNPSVDKTNEVMTVPTKNEEGKEAQHEVKPEEKPEGKVLIRTERVTELEEPKHRAVPADQPMLQAIQKLRGSNKEKKSEI